MKDRETETKYVSLETAGAFARDRLSEKRYAHTLRVAGAAGRLARIHGIDEYRTRLAAILHDAARETSPEEFLRLADEWGLPVGDAERATPKLLHGPVAAELARREMGVKDEEVLEAVRVHTSGAPRMSLLALTLYVADKIEPARDYPSVNRIRRLAEENLHAAAREGLRHAIAHNEERGRPTHPISLETLEWLEAQDRADYRME